jgi:hypothetical protein
MGLSLREVVAVFEWLGSERRTALLAHPWRSPEVECYWASGRVERVVTVSTVVL